jgi:subtilisin family serine protease
MKNKAFVYSLAYLAFFSFGLSVSQKKEAINSLTTWIQPDIWVKDRELEKDSGKRSLVSKGHLLVLYTGNLSKYKVDLVNFRDFFNTQNASVGVSIGSPTEIFLDTTSTTTQVCGKPMIDFPFTPRDKDVSEVIRLFDRTVLNASRSRILATSSFSGAAPKVIGHPAAPSTISENLQDIAVSNQVVRELSDAQTVRVAVLDTGLNTTIDTENVFNSADGVSFITTSTDPSEPDPIYTDHKSTPNSFRDDFNFPTAISSFTGSGTEPLKGHGTPVASIISEVGRFGPHRTVSAASPILRIGVANNATIIPVKVCDKNGICPDTSVIAGICYAAARRPDNKPRASVMNLSLGSFIESPIMKGAIQDAVNAGTLVITAAGNSRSQPHYTQPPGITDEAQFCLSEIPDLDNSNLTAAQKRSMLHYNCPVYPAAFSRGASRDTDGIIRNADGILSVGSVSPNLRFSNSVPQTYRYSEFATKNSRIDLVAPGDQVVALDADFALTRGIERLLRLGLSGPLFPRIPQSVAIGTSFAAAHVSGVAAAVIARRGDRGQNQLSPAQLERLLRESASNESLENSFPAYGAGMVNLREALNRSDITNPR